MKNKWVMSPFSLRQQGKQEEAQASQASCLNLLTNAVVAWNTVYMAAALDQLREEGHPVDDEDVAHLSPVRYEHINPYGRYSFDVEVNRKRPELRPLRARAMAS